MGLLKLSLWPTCLQVVSDKHDDVMAKLGAILAQGILDAGGRNVTVALLSRTGHVNMAAVVGMLVFTQFWYAAFCRPLSVCSPPLAPLKESKRT